MARPDGDAIPVMDRANVKKPTTRGAGAATTASSPRKGRARTLAGPWKASFDGTDGFGNQVPGLTFERRWTRPGVHPYDEITWELRDGRASPTSRARRVFEQKDVEVPELLEPARHQRRRQQVLPRPPRHAGARAQRQASSSTASSTRSPPGPRPSTTSRPTRTCAAFQAELTHLLVHQKMAFNSPVWFNVGIEEKPQCSACFINSVAGHDGARSWTSPRPRACSSSSARAPAQPLHHPSLARRRCRGGGTASRPGLLHEGLRRLRRRHQVGRQDPPRGQDGHPRRRPSRHHRVHRLARRNEEKKAWALIEPGYDPSLHRRGLRLGLLPERQPLRPRDRRVHAGRRATDADWTTHAVIDGEPVGHATRPATSSARWPRRPGSAATRASSTTPRSTTGTPARTRTASTRQQPVLRVHVPQRHGLQPGVSST